MWTRGKEREEYKHEIKMGDRQEVKMERNIDRR